MSGFKTDSFFLPLTTIVGEQSKVGIEPPIDSFNLTADKNFLKQVDEDERDDKFIYAFTDSGISENGRNWKPEHMKSMAKQVIEKMPVGYLGHIKPQDYGFEFPDPQIVWFGSYTETLKNKSTRLWIKGYMLPTAEKLQKWIKLKAVDTISVYGKITYNMTGKVMDIQEIDLKSIDIARKLGEGLNSGIVGLYGEMAETYEDVRDILQKKCREYFQLNAYDLGIFKPMEAEVSKVTNGDDCCSSPSVYCYIKKMYHAKDVAIISVEGRYPDKFLYEVEYEVDAKKSEVTIKSVAEVEEKVTYTKVKSDTSSFGASTVSDSDNKEATPTSVGEMNETKEAKQMANVDLSQITVEDIRSNPTLYGQLRTSIAQEMANEDSQNVLVTKAGEMDAIVAVMGEQEDYAKAIASIIRFNASFVGEMSSIIFGGEADEAAEPEEIIEAVKNQKATLDKVKETVGVDEDEDVVEAVEDAIEANTEALAQTAKSEVQAAFDEAIKSVKNETVADYVKDDFSDVLEADLSEVEDIDQWKKDALALIKDEFDGVVDKHTKKLSKVIKGAKAVGEMNAFGDLGMGSSMNPDEQQDGNEDADVAFAKSMGYGNL